MASTCPKTQKALARGSPEIHVDPAQRIDRDGDDTDPARLKSDDEASLWHKIDNWPPPRNPDQDFWWKVTGSQLSNLLQKAGYPPRQQHEYLIFHHDIVVPRMGPQPQPCGTPSWKSFMTDDFSPIEYSWKWGLGNDRPEIRFGVELIGPDAGTAVDPYNRTSTTELMVQLEAAVPCVDLTLFHQFSSYFEPGKTDSPLDSGWGSSVFTAFEFSHTGIGVKAYFVPRSLSRGEEFLATGFRKVVQKTSGNNGKDNSLDALEVLSDFVNTDQDGSKLRMILLGIDCVEPTKSRVKVYMRTPGTSFNHLTAIMALGGRRKIHAKALAELRELWSATLGLDENFSSSAELPFNSHETSGLLFYFDVKPGGSVPDVKGYIPVRHYGKNDQGIASGLTTFLAKRGQGWFVEGYMSMLLAAFGEQANLGGSKGLHTYISFSFQKQGDLALTSYLSPQIYTKSTSQDRYHCQGR